MPAVSTCVTSLWTRSPVHLATEVTAGVVTRFTLTLAGVPLAAVRVIEPALRAAVAGAAQVPLASVQVTGYDASTSAQLASLLSKPSHKIAELQYRAV